MIRPFRSQDLEPVIALNRRIYSDEYGIDWNDLIAREFQWITRHLSPSSDLFLVDVEEDEVVGSVALVGESRELAVLRWLAVAPAHRGKGLGGELLDQALSFALRAGYRVVTLLTRPEFERALRLYSGRGFVYEIEMDRQGWRMLRYSIKFPLRSQPENEHG